MRIADRLGMLDDRCSRSRQQEVTYTTVSNNCRIVTDTYSIQRSWECVLSVECGSLEVYIRYIYVDC